MPFSVELVASLLSNKDKIFRYAFIAQAITALIFLTLGYYMGKDHFHLIREGVRTQGRVVGYSRRISEQQREIDRTQMWLSCPWSNSRPAATWFVSRIGRAHRQPEF